jgi:hypothetical protein
MRPAVMLNLFVATQANGNAVRNAVENRILDGAGRELVEPVTVITWHRGLLVVNAYVFCPSASDADTLVADIIATWTSGPQANRIVSGSWVRRINSFADEGLSDVIVSETVKA